MLASATEASGMENLCVAANVFHFRVEKKVKKK